MHALEFVLDTKYPGAGQVQLRIAGPEYVHSCWHPPLLAWQRLIGSHPLLSELSVYPESGQVHVDELSPVNVHVWAQPPLLTAHLLYKHDDELEGETKNPWVRQEHDRAAGPV